MNYYEPRIDQLELLKLRFEHFSCRVERIPLSLSSLLDPTVLALVRCNNYQAARIKSWVSTLVLRTWHI